MSRILRSARLSRIKDLEPAEPVVRYPRDPPGDMIHLDIKKLGRFERVGHRITGERKAQSSARGKRGGESWGAVWEFVHVCINDASRIAFSQVMADEKKESAVAFLKAAVAYYASLGVTVTRVMTDNSLPSGLSRWGACYKAFAFREACKMLGLQHARPGPTPQRPTERPNASSRLRFENGPTPTLTPAQIAAKPNSTTGCTATTGIDPTAASNYKPQSANSPSPRTTC